MSAGIATTICLACGAQYSLGIREPGQRCSGLENVRGLSDPSCPGRVISAALYVALAYELGFSVPQDAPPFPAIASHAVVEPFWVSIEDEKGFVRVIKDHRIIAAWAEAHQAEIIGAHLQAQSERSFNTWQAEREQQQEEKATS